MDIVFIGMENSTNEIIRNELKQNYDCTIHSLEFDSPKDRAADITSMPADIVIIDLHTTPGQAPDTIKTLSNLLPGTPLLALHIHTEYKLITPLLTQGAKGYLTTSVSEKELTEAVKTVLEGNVYVETALQPDNKHWN